MSDLGDLLDTFTQRILTLEGRVDALERLEHGAWRGTSTGDFTTTTLPNPGDYGYQTTAGELQMNVGGSIRAVAVSAL